MYSKSFANNLNYKLRELELIIRQLESDNNPSKIDIDLALEKTRNLYEILLNLEKVNLRVTDHSSGTSGKTVVPADPETVQDDREYENEGIMPDPVHKQKEEPGPVYGKSDIESASESKEQEEQDKKQKTRGDTGDSIKPDNQPPVKSIPGDAESPTDKDEKGPESKKKNGSQEIEIVADRYQSSQNYIDRALANKKGNSDLTARLQSRPISDLRNSIGLNEKFLFIKELFKGRPEKYNQCIDSLNQSTSFEEAMNYIRSNFSWDENDEATKKLVNLVKRKHQAE